MGSSALAGMLEMASFEQALHWHLTSNHMPSLDKPHHFALAKKAIEMGQEGLSDEPCKAEVEGRLTWADDPFSGQPATAGQLIDAWHLGDFLESDDED